MGRHPTSTSYITPIKSDGVPEVADATEFGRGAFTLALGTTYYYPLGGQDSPTQTVHIRGDASIILTSAVIEECCMPPSDVTWYASGAAGLWVKDNGTAGLLSVVGTGWTATARTLSVTGGTAGGALFQLTDRGARRSRLAIVVGATGGELVVAGWSKE